MLSSSGMVSVAEIIYSQTIEIVLKSLQALDSFADILLQLLIFFGMF